MIECNWFTVPFRIMLFNGLALGNAKILKSMNVCFIDWAPEVPEIWTRTWMVDVGWLEILTIIFVKWCSDNVFSHTTTTNHDTPLFPENKESSISDNNQNRRNGLSLVQFANAAYWKMLFLYRFCMFFMDETVRHTHTSYAWGIKDFIAMMWDLRGHQQCNKAWNGVRETIQQLKSNVLNASVCSCVRYYSISLTMLDTINQICLFSMRVLSFSNRWSL